MLLNDKFKYTDKEIIEKGSRVLINELGYSGFLRFIRYSEGRSKEDYLNLEKDIFQDEALGKIFEDAKRFWEDK